MNKERRKKKPQLLLKAFFFGRAYDIILSNQSKQATNTNDTTPSKDCVNPSNWAEGSRLEYGSIG